MRQYDKPVGQKFGRLTVVKFLERIPYPSGFVAYKYSCMCECGTEISASIGNLKSGHVKSCGCIKNIDIDSIIGKTYNRLTVMLLEFSRQKNGFIEPYFRCMCECGEETIVAWYRLSAGKTKSCGCARLKPDELCKLSSEKKLYKRMHVYINKVKGQANGCLHCGDGTKSRYEWALIKGREYSFNPDDYISLCSKCHRIYDLKAETGLKISRSSKASTKNKGGNNHSARSVIDCRTGKVFSTVKEAALAVNLKRPTLSMMLLGRVKNKTSLKYA